ncbi:hypothetical protein D3C81_1186810 [compost metagenome]
MRPTADQELVELVRAVFVHAALGVAVLQVALVKRELLVGTLGRQDAALQVSVACHAAALAAVGGEAVDRDAHRHAGAAALAVRAIHQVAGATEAPAQCHRIQAGEAVVLRIEHQIACLPVGPVATGMFAGLEQAQFLVGVAV